MALDKFNVNIVSKKTMPDIKYINELARAKSFQFNSDFNEAPPILEDLYALYLKEREEEDAFDFKNHALKKSIISEQLNRELTESEDIYYNYTLKFLSGLNYRDCPGFSPMDKALNTIMYLTDLSKKSNKNKSQEHASTNPLDDNSESISPSSLDEMIKDLSNGVSKDSEDSKKEGSETKQDIISCVRDFLYDLSPSISNVYGNDAVTSTKINLRILKDIKVKGYLENKLGLETSLEKKMIDNNNSKIKKIRNMKSHTELMKASKSQMILPTFDDKFAKKEVLIKTKIKPETKKQRLTMLLDDSGSMNCIQKQSYVRAVLMNRLQSVIEGKAELDFYLYESSRYGHKNVKTVQDARELYAAISKKRPGGGGTHIGAILQQTINDIYDIPGYHDPEIIIVNDGDKEYKNFIYYNLY